MQLKLKILSKAYLLITDYLIINREKDEYYQNKEKEDNLKLKSEMEHYVDLLRNVKYLVLFKLL